MGYLTIPVAAFSFSTMFWKMAPIPLGSIGSKFTIGQYLPITVSLRLTMKVGAVIGHCQYSTMTIQKYGNTSWRLPNIGLSSASMVGAWMCRSRLKLLGFGKSFAIASKPSIQKLTLSGKFGEIRGSGWMVRSSMG